MQNLLQHATKNGLCSLQEYEAILFELTSREPRNMLVFGLGFDAPLWIAATAGSELHFLENHKAWIEKSALIPNVHPVVYGTHKWKRDKIHTPSELQMELPHIVLQTRWDVIFVDGPPLKAKRYGLPDGRMKSVYWARKLASRNTTVFVHDYNRSHEKLLVDHWFADWDKTVVKRLVKLSLR